MRALGSAFLVLICTTVPGTANAAPPSAERGEKPGDLEPRIYGGTPVNSCAWPSVVSMQGSCTGTLIHPELVVYAAHCGSGYSSIHFGDSVQGGGGFDVPTEYCQIHHPVNNDNLGSGEDVAFCKLATPVENIQIVPPLMGCETTALLPNGETVAVGFGQADNGPYGIKREVTITMSNIGEEVYAGGLGKGTCQGDSGGPLFINLSEELGGDDTWRVFGITSWGPEGCMSGGSFGTMFHNMEWLESESGLDLTPCTDADGTWNPDGRCRNFPLDPVTGGGSWADGCNTGELADHANAICGPAIEDDLTAPTVAITNPMTGMVASTGPDGAAMLIEADAFDEGWGLQEVRLLIDGNEIATDTSEPFEWNATLPPGQFVLEAVAYDMAGNEAISEPVYIGVDQEAPVPPEPSDDDGGEDESGDGDGDEGDTGDDPGAEEPGDKGCGCGVDRPVGAAGWAWLPALLVFRRRRLSR